MKTIHARWLFVSGLMIAVLAVNLYADSVSVSTSFKVLPYQTFFISETSFQLRHLNGKDAVTISNDAQVLLHHREGEFEMD